MTDKIKNTARLLLFFVVISLFIAGSVQAQFKSAVFLEKQLQDYRANLQELRQEHQNQREMPDLKFFLFGMGDRRKMIYRNGILKDARTGEVVRQWPVKSERIIPSLYAVLLETKPGERVQIIEDEKGVWLQEGTRKTALSQSKMQLPDFTGKKYAPILKVLHHEVLINIIDGKPVPNYFVYKKPWFRDATLMGMVLQKSNNLHLIKEWVLAIRDPFDRNNHGISEADNPGQVLYLISLVSDKNHPAVVTVLDSVKQFVKPGKLGTYLEGKTDYALHPVFQTKWMKFGLKALGLPDPYQIPKVYDQYSPLFWWEYKDQHVNGQRFDRGSSQNYPYLVWAEDHFFGEKQGIVTNRDYPLTWEAHASDANYPGMKMLDESLVAQKMSPPHTWHAAEMFLLLYEQEAK